MKTTAMTATLRRHRSTAIRVAVVLGVWLLLATLGSASNQSARERNTNLAAQAEQARTQAARVQLLRDQRHPRPAASSLSLMTLTEQGAKRYRLDTALKQMDPQDEHHLRVILRDARFDDMMLWWGQLQTEAGVSVTDAEISAGSVSGLVNAQATLSRQ